MLGVMGKSRLLLVVKYNAGDPERFQVIHPDSAVSRLGHAKNTVPSQAVFCCISLPLSIFETSQPVSTWRPQPAPVVNDWLIKDLIAIAVGYGHRLKANRLGTGASKRCAAENPSIASYPDAVLGVHQQTPNLVTRKTRFAAVSGNTLSVTIKPCHASGVGPYPNSSHPINGNPPDPF